MGGICSHFCSLWTERLICNSVNKPEEIKIEKDNIVNLNSFIDEDSEVFPYIEMFSPGDASSVVVSTKSHTEKPFESDSILTWTSVSNSLSNLASISSSTSTSSSISESLSNSLMESTSISLSSSAWNSLSNSESNSVSNLTSTMTTTTLVPEQSCNTSISSKDQGEILEQAINQCQQLPSPSPPLLEEPFNCYNLWGASKTPVRSCDLESGSTSSIEENTALPSVNHHSPADYILDPIFQTLSANNNDVQNHGEVECVSIRRSPWNVISTPTQCSLRLTYLFDATDRSENNAVRQKIIRKMFSSKFKFVNKVSVFTGSLGNNLFNYFFMERGRFIKKIDIVHDPDLFPDPPEFEVLEFLLKEQLPYLETLMFHDFPEKWEWGPGPQAQLSCNSFRSQNLYLPHLKTLGFEPTNNIGPNFLTFLCFIFEAAVNLERLEVNYKEKEAEGYNEVLIHLVKLGPKYVTLLKNLSFVNENMAQNPQQMLYTYSIIATCKPRLEYLSVNYHMEFTNPEMEHQFVGIINECLKSSSNSLKVLGDFDVITQLPGIKFPNLVNLTELVYDTHTDVGLDLDENEGQGRRKGIRMGLSLWFKFPRLSKISIRKIGALALNPDENRDGIITQFTSIKELNFSPNSNSTSDHDQLTWINRPSMNYITQKFPNLTTAKFPQCVNFTQVAPCIWKNLIYLQKLDITIALNDSSGNSFPIFDAGFTGFPLPVCYQLFDAGDSANVLLGNLNHLRVNPSILNLKKLKDLKIRFVIEEWDMPFPVLTHVAGQFGFQMCPGLHVTICIDGSKREEDILYGLNGVLPYVHFVD